MVIFEKKRFDYGSSMDSKIIRELFMLCIESTRILQEDQEFGKHGQIQKWSIDYNELNPGYLYYLFALHPGTQITLETIPDLAKAARVTLDRRLQHGGGHTGWSRAWILNMWAFRSVEKAKSRYLWSMPYSPHFFAKHHILLMTFFKDHLSEVAFFWDTNQVQIGLMNEGICLVSQNMWKTDQIEMGIKLSLPIVLDMLYCWRKRNTRIRSRELWDLAEDIASVFVWLF